MAKILIPSGIDYRSAVDDLVEILKSMGLGCVSLGHEQNDAQLIVQSSGIEAGKEASLTEGQRGQIASSLPILTLQ